MDFEVYVQLGCSLTADRKAALKKLEILRYDKVH